MACGSCETTGDAKDDEEAGEGEHADGHDGEARTAVRDAIAVKNGHAERVDVTIRCAGMFVGRKEDLKEMGEMEGIRRSENS